MTHLRIIANLHHRLFAGFLLVFCFLVSGLVSIKADTSTFAQFVQRSGSNKFVFTNNTSNATFQTISGGAPIYFYYDDERITGLDASLTGPQSAHLTVSSSTANTATLNGATLDQPFSSTVIIQVLRDTAAPIGGGSRRNLLTIYINQNTDKADLSGVNNGNSGTFSATTPDHNVFFTSDFLSFGSTSARNMALSFSSVISSLSVGSGSFLNSFTAAGTGTFASNPIPVYQGSPTAATFEVSGKVLSPTGAGVNKARVYLTDANGETQIARTNAFGYFRFEDVPTGQSIVYVMSKQFNYVPQSFNLVGVRGDLNFIPEE